MLAAIATASGGQYVHLSTADHLIEQLDRSQRKKTVFVEAPPLLAAGVLGIVGGSAYDGLDFVEKVSLR